MFTGFAVASACLLWFVALRSAILLGLWREADLLVSVSLVAATVALARVLAALRCRCNCATHYDQDPHDLEAPPHPPPPQPPQAPPPPDKRRKRKGKKNSDKNKQPGSVRRGCILNLKRKAVENPGPKYNPGSLRNVRKKTQTDNKHLKLEQALSLPQCTWSTSCHGGLRARNSSVQCCKKKNCYRTFREETSADMELTIIVRDYRRYYHNLSQEAKQAWWAEHTDYNGYEKHQEGNELRRGGRSHTFRFESFATMKFNLNQLNTNPSMTLPPVRPASMHPVCGAFCVFMVAGHWDTLYQNTIRQHAFAKKDGADPTDLDARLGAVRSIRKDTGGGADGKATHAKVWLKEQGALALLDPTEDMAILPFRTRQAAHEHYILDHEHKAGRAWAVYNPDPEPPEPVEPNGLEDVDGEQAAAGDPADSGCDIDEEEFHEVDEQAYEAVRERLRRAAREKRAILEEERAKRRLLKYRYGNPQCGVKDPAKPEDPALAYYTTFNKAWNSDPALQKILCRAHLKFAKCDFCVRHRQLKDRKRTEEERAKDNEELRAHLQHVKDEKSYYYSNRLRARQHPDKILSIIIDGADQSKHHLPHFHEESHATSEALRFKTHLYGVLVHGHGAWAFTMPDHEQQGHNVTIQALYEVLSDIKKEYGVLPPVLKLQLDNTTKQNKGQFLFGFLAMLVALGHFNEVEVNFLPVGHTHEDIDQFFSRISLRLRCDLFCAVCAVACPVCLIHR